MKSKGIGSSILKQYKRATKGIFLPKPLGAAKVRDLKVQLQHGSQSSPKPRATFAFYRISHVLAKHETPFNDGNIVKEPFLEAADSLFEHFKNRAQIVKAIRRGTLPQYMQAKEWLCMRKFIDACECLFLPLSRVDWYVTRLCLFIRMVFEDMTAKEDLLPSLPGHTREKDIFNVFVGFVKERKLPLSSWC